MKYEMKAGVLYAGENVCARFKGTLAGTEKRIESVRGDLLLITDVCQWDEKQTDALKSKQYVMLTPERRICASGRPDYAEGEEPDAQNWPVCRMPRVDRAGVVIRNKQFLLIMKNSQNYVLKDEFGKTAIQIFHRGLLGGWDIEASDEFSPELICGIFVFCRYIEQENELRVV